MPDPASQGAIAVCNPDGTFISGGGSIATSGTGNPTLTGNLIVTGTSNLQGVITGPAGTQAAPAINLSDTDSGFYRHTANGIAIGIQNGATTLKMINGSSVFASTNSTLYFKVANTGSSSQFDVQAGDSPFVKLTPQALAGGGIAFQVTPGAHTAVTAEAIDVNFAAHTMTITGSYATQRFVDFGIPTISAATALTVTTAATVTIEGAPAVAGAGPAAITNPYAFWIKGGAVRTDGNTYAIQATAKAYALATTGSGANNPATAAQNAWLQLEDSTGKFWVPIWR